MQKPVYFCVPKIQDLLHKTFDENVEFTAIAMALKFDYHFELKTFWPSNTPSLYQ